MIAASAQAPTLDAIVPRIERTVVTADIPALEQGRDELRVLSGDDSANGQRLERYTLAYVEQSLPARISVAQCSVWSWSFP